MILMLFNAHDDAGSIYNNIIIEKKLCSLSYNIEFFKPKVYTFGYFQTPPSCFEFKIYTTTHLSQVASNPKMHTTSDTIFCTISSALSHGVICFDLSVSPRNHYHG